MARFPQPVPQYFDDAGDPLVNGKLFFFTSGTSSPKDTFADVGLTVPNTNPVILSGAGRVPPIFYDGTARVVLTSNDDVQIWDRDPVGADSFLVSFEPWNSVVIYGQGVIVRFDGGYYVSIQDNNQNNVPSSTSAFWQQIEFINIWNVNTVYSLNETVKASDGFLYRSTTSSNQGNDPITDLVNWQNLSFSTNPQLINSAMSPFPVVPGQFLLVDLSTGPVELQWDVTSGTPLADRLRVASVLGDPTTNALTVVLTGGNFNIGGVSDPEVRIWDINEDRLFTLVSAGVVVMGD